MRPQWLQRSLITGPYYTLCLSQAELDAELRRLGIKRRVSFTMTDHANAATHFLDDNEGKQCAIVCLGDWTGREPIVVAGLLVHEATHIWQAWCERVGERNAGDETEAYAIQWLSQQLMWEFVPHQAQALNPECRPGANHDETRATAEDPRAPAGREDQRQGTEDAAHRQRRRRPRRAHRSRGGCHHRGTHRCARHAMTTRTERLAVVNAALKRQREEAARAERDARKAASELEVKAAARTASPAGLVALFRLNVTATKKG